MQDKSKQIRDILSDLQNNVLAAIALVMIVIVAAIGSAPGSLFSSGLAGLLGAATAGKPAQGLPEALVRQSPYLTHPVFKAHRSETQMLRYLRKLQLKDIALDRSMIPLGSCTMKLNAAVEMMPVSMAGFAHIHPFAPAEQTAGYRILFEELERMLANLRWADIKLKTTQVDAKTVLQEALLASHLRKTLAYAVT